VGYFISFPEETSISDYLKLSDSISGGVELFGF